MQELRVAKTLIKRGVRPIILDVGETLPARGQIVRRMSQQHVSEWKPEDLAIITEIKTVSERRLPPQ
jgi:hypothetical protein